MKRWLWWRLTDIRDIWWLPDFIVDPIDDLRYHDYFKKMWGIDD